MDFIEYETEEEAEEAENLKSAILSDQIKQNSFVRGHEKGGRSIIILRSRSAADTDEEEFITSTIHTMERAIAVTEHDTNSKQEKVMVVLDFGEFKSSLSPSLHSAKRMSAILQNHYPERLYKLIVIDPPFWMRTMYNLLKPFLDPETKKKFMMATGDKQKENMFKELVDDAQAMPFMIPSGKLTDPVDIEHFLKVVPFHCPYDGPSQSEETTT